MNNTIDLKFYFYFEFVSRIKIRKFQAIDAFINFPKQAVIEICKQEYIMLTLSKLCWSDIVQDCNVNDVIMNDVNEKNRFKQCWHAVDSISWQIPMSTM